ncbi:alcohol dehydrogenase catalytic domain-containing protein [Streptomyces sp. NPDC055025]
MFEGWARRRRIPVSPRGCGGRDTVAGSGRGFDRRDGDAINYNTVWSLIFGPVPAFGFLKRCGCLIEQARRHDLPYHVLGSDLAGVVLRTGPGVNRWRPGDRVVAHCRADLSGGAGVVRPGGRTPGRSVGRARFPEYRAASSAAPAACRSRRSRE